MSFSQLQWGVRGGRLIKQLLNGPQAVAFVPALALAAFWFGGEGLLVIVALGLPMLMFFSSPPAQTTAPVSLGFLPELPIKNLEQHLVQILSDARSTGAVTACYLLHLDGPFPTAAAGEELRSAYLRNLRSCLRQSDLAGWTNGNTLVVAMAPNRRLDLDAAIQAARRFQTTLEDPVAAGGRLWHVSVCVGLAISTRLASHTDGTDMLNAAQLALQEARQNGASAIRTYSAKRHKTQQKSALPPSEAVAALENGGIRPWYQPQLCTETGRISGLEALARWSHPTRGLIAPAEFLPALQRGAALSRLGDCILYHACRDLAQWDKAGLNLPQVGVNFSEDELADPRLIERVRTTLDKFGLSPDRLRIEVTENVALSGAVSDAARSVTALSKLGCKIDLDDFGTGATALTALQNINVDRLKIDRSFVRRVDRDEAQRRLLAAILGMAERLGIETLAEGVESHGEHALVAQLGCTHVQGFGIARPMPGAQIPDWVTGQQARLAKLPRLGLVRRS